MPPSGKEFAARLLADHASEIARLSNGTGSVDDRYRDLIELILAVYEAAYEEGLERGGQFVLDAVTQHE